jgi:integrase
VLPSLSSVDAQVAAFADADLSPRTRREYAAQWRTFTDWAAARQLRALPCSALDLARYVTERAHGGLKPTSLGVAISAIAWHHGHAGVADEALPHRNADFQRVLSGIRRMLGTAPRRATPVLVDELRAMVAGLPDNLAGHRTRCLIVLGFAGVFRRSELVALTVADLEFRRGGLLVHVRKSKTDQEQIGVTIDICYGSAEATCPVRSTQRWLEASGITSGPLLRGVTAAGRIRRKALGADAVAVIIKQRAVAAGLDPELFSGHSLRSGAATQAAKCGKDDRAIMKAGRWAGRAMVDRYVRDSEQFSARNATAGIGL